MKCRNFAFHQPHTSATELTERVPFPVALFCPQNCLKIGTFTVNSISCDHFRVA